jgi:diketogulonate reductase-like aldo/keto reductase
MYKSETKVGKAIAASQVPRADIFMTTRIWPDNFSRLLPSRRESMARLRVEQVDLRLLNRPAPSSTPSRGATTNGVARRSASRWRGWWRSSRPRGFQKNASLSALLYGCNSSTGSVLSATASFIG